jgi:hypothetical protein
MKNESLWPDQLALNGQEGRHGFAGLFQRRIDAWKDLVSFEMIDLPQKKREKLVDGRPTLLLFIS